MKSHEAYTAPDMPARKLESYVKKGLESGAGIEPVAIAKVLYKIASRGDKVPLRLPIGNTALMLIRMKLEAQLQDLEIFKELSIG